MSEQTAIRSLARVLGSFERHLKPRQLSIITAMTTTVPEPKPAAAPEAALQRQFVNFMFFRVDRAFRSESDEVKAEAKREFAEIVKRFTGPLMLLPYSTVGLKAGLDFMLWRIGFDIDPFQQMVADINRSILGRYLDGTERS